MIYQRLFWDVLGTQFSEAKGNGSSKTNHFTILLVSGGFVDN